MLSPSLCFLSTSPMGRCGGPAVVGGGGAVAGRHGRRRRRR